MITGVSVAVIVLDLHVDLIDCNILSFLCSLSPSSSIDNPADDLNWLVLRFKHLLAEAGIEVTLFGVGEKAFLLQSKRRRFASVLVMFV